MKIGYLMMPRPEDCRITNAETGEAIEGFAGATIETSEDGHRLILELDEFVIYTPNQVQVAVVGPCKAPEPSRN